MNENIELHPNKVVKQYFELAPDEIQVIQCIRLSNKYANVKIEKRPTKQNNSGALISVAVENLIRLD